MIYEDGSFAFGAPPPKTGKWRAKTEVAPTPPLQCSIAGADCGAPKATQPWREHVQGRCHACGAAVCFGVFCSRVVAVTEGRKVRRHRFCVKCTIESIGQR